MNELTQEKIRLFWWTSSNRRVTKAHHRTAWRPFELIQLKLCIFFLNERSFRLIRPLFIFWNCLKAFEQFAVCTETVFGIFNRWLPVKCIWRKILDCFHQKS